MEFEKIAHVNEVQLIGKVIKQPEHLKTAAGRPFVRLTIETERFVIVQGNRQRIVQTHTVVIRKETNAISFVRPGVTVRVVGELSYDPKPEITVWDHLHFSLMSMPRADVSTANAKNPETEAQKPAAAAPTTRSSTGGPGRISVPSRTAAQAVNQNDDPGPADNDDDDDDTSSNANIFNSPVFSHSGDISDEIPF